MTAEITYRVQFERSPNDGLNFGGVTGPQINELRMIIFGDLWTNTSFRLNDDQISRIDDWYNRVSGQNGCLRYDLADCGRVCLHVTPDSAR